MAGDSWKPAVRKACKSFGGIILWRVVLHHNGSISAILAGLIAIATTPKIRNKKRSCSCSKLWFTCEIQTPEGPAAGATLERTFKSIGIRLGFALGKPGASENAAVNLKIMKPNAPNGWFSIFTYIYSAVLNWRKSMAWDFPLPNKHISLMPSNACSNCDHGRSTAWHRWSSCGFWEVSIPLSLS